MEAERIDGSNATQSSGRLKLVSDVHERRSVPARIGLVALNLVAPGLGLLRLGCARAGSAFLLTPFLLIGLVTFGALNLPITGDRHAVFALIALLVLLLAGFALPAVLTWRASPFRGRVPAWSRWYALATVAVVTLAMLQIAQHWSRGFYQAFTVPSESMSPTPQIDDRFVADMRWRGPFHRGDVVLIEASGGVRINRVVGLPGDEVAMQGGVPVINGQTATQAQESSADVRGQVSDGIVLLVEKLPGAPSRHLVLDEGQTPFDDMRAVVVPAGHLFLLGDHRDRSADSRMTIDQNGIGMVPFSAVIGKPRYIHWSSNHSRTGLRLISSSATK